MVSSSKKLYDDNVICSGFGLMNGERENYDPIYYLYILLLCKIIDIIDKMLSIAGRPSLYIYPVYRGVDKNVKISLVTNSVFGDISINFVYQQVKVRE